MGGGASARRLVVFFSPNGTVHEHWRPEGGGAEGADFSFPAGSILEPLAAQKDDLLIVDGLDFKNGNNHEGGMADMLTGGGGGGGGGGDVSGGMSLDQFVADRIGGQTRFSSLELGVQTSAWGGSVQTRMSYKGPGQFVAPEDDPAGVFARVFGGRAGGNATERGGGADPDQLRRKSVIDHVRRDLLTLRGRLGLHERRKLELHLEALRQMEKGLMGGTATLAAGCEPPATGRLSAKDNDAFPMVGAAQTDLLVSALACDATRVATLQWSHTVSPTVFTWLGQSEGHHSLSHSNDGNAGGVGQFVQAERWFAERFGELIEKLRALPDPMAEGSMLDNTVVVWAKELGDSRLHRTESVPFVLAGGAAAGLKTGRYLRFDGRSHQDLLVSIARAMGIDIDRFGNSATCEGPLQEVFA